MVEMDLKRIHNVYFIGIGGIGMSALARYFKFIGKNVAGYDKTQTPLTEELSGLDMDIHYQDDINDVADLFKNKENLFLMFCVITPLLNTKSHIFWNFRSKTHPFSSFRMLES